MIHPIESERRIAKNRFMRVSVRMLQPTLQLDLAEVLRKFFIHLTQAYNMLTTVTHTDYFCHTGFNKMPTIKWTRKQELFKSTKT
jgi:hypothetical protein